MKSGTWQGIIGAALLAWSVGAVGSAATSAPATGAEVVALPEWTAPAGGQAVAFTLDEAEPKFRIWGGRGTGVRHYFEELLPALFERTLEFDAGESPGELAWIFTGERGGFTLTLRAGQVEWSERHYDSPGYNAVAGGTPPRHPEWRSPPVIVPFTGAVRAVTVTLDHRLGLGVALNGREVMRRTYGADLSRHQVHLSKSQAAWRGRLWSPPRQEITIDVEPVRRHQTMLGFGGIATPTAYAQLSLEGKHQWWRMLCEFNLLVQREYPNGQRLHEAMDNWDRLADATPHYYGDNFPNGEISDFDYLRTLRRLGGSVWFEFWSLPPWVGREVEQYARAMVRYCEVSRQKAGAPPEIVGIQNEVEQTPEQWQRMTLALRRQLDAAGFGGVRIHLSDASQLRGGIKRAEAVRASPAAWAATDYAASHVYDYQKDFTDPDRYDAVLRQWRAAIGEKPFLSTEICVNDSRYQWPSYRLALTMGQLYHKNLVLADAVALAYCWTLLNVEQPSYGWTRSLCVPDPARGFGPVASSHQLRVFGAYSRRIHAGMTRVAASGETGEVLAAAFSDGRERQTMVLLNRSMRPQSVRVAWPGVRFTTVETVDPYRPNEARPIAGSEVVPVEPGAIVTLTTVPLLRGPADLTGDPARPVKDVITNGAAWKGGRAQLWPDVRRPKVESSFLYQPTTEWTYSHHQSIAFFRGRFHAIWSNGRQDEDAPGQRVLWATSPDGRAWTTPRPLVDSVVDANGVERVLTAAGFHEHAGTLVAYFGNYGPKKETTHLQAVTTTDGEHWSAVREMGVPVNPNHGPQRTASGRLIISGNISFPYTDDPSGLTGWRMTGIYPAAMAATIKDDPVSFKEVAQAQGWRAALCEGSFYQTDDGVLHLLLRDTTKTVVTRHLWLTESRDDGATWTTPVETAFSDTNAKFHCGRLPDGRFYYVGNPVGGGRTPLVLSLSRDGVHFDRHFILGETRYERRRAGESKGGEYGYPHTLIHAGGLYVIVSRQKEAVEVLRVALADLADREGGQR